MKKLLFSALVLTANTNVIAQGYYEFIPYWGNNPFLFCTYGVPQDCWAPVSPQLGTYVVTDEYCFNAWSASLYSRVCPKAFPNGVAGSSAMLQMNQHKRISTHAQIALR
jgi:hypothetical protein